MITYTGIPARAYTVFLTTLKEQPPRPTTEADTTPVHIRTSTTTVTTDRAKWHAFVLGVKAGEFGHFAKPTTS
jgi:hypothetical protein